MKSVKCKKCNCDIFAEYSSIESLNEEKSFFDFFRKKKKIKRYFSELEQYPTKTCYTSIYLTCENNHTLNYYCKIEEHEIKK